MEVTVGGFPGVASGVHVISSNVPASCAPNAVPTELIDLNELDPGSVPSAWNGPSVAVHTKAVCIVLSVVDAFPTTVPLKSNDVASTTSYPPGGCTSKPSPAAELKNVPSGVATAPVAITRYTTSPFSLNKTESGIRRSVATPRFATDLSKTNSSGAADLANGANASSERKLIQRIFINCAIYFLPNRLPINPIAFGIPLPAMKSST